MIFGRSPFVNNSISWASYIVGLILMTCNIGFSTSYFLSGVPNPNDPTTLQFWGSLTAALFMSGYEAIMLGVLTTPTAWHYVVKVPRFIKNLSDKEAQKTVKFIGTAILVLSMGLLCTVYYFDWSTTFGGLDMKDETIARFLTTCLVIGSEVLFIGGNICAWLAYIGEREEDEIRVEVNSGTIQTSQFDGSAHTVVSSSDILNQKRKKF